MDRLIRYWIQIYALIALALVGQMAQATSPAGGNIAQLNDKRLALLIGVENYNPSTHWSTLNYAVDDVSVMGETLEQQGYSTYYLRSGPDGDYRYSDSIDKREIFYKLRQLAAITPEPELFLLAFSGHGFSLDNDNYLALPDTPSVAPRKNNPIGLLSVKELETEVRKILKPRKLVMFFDACRDENRSDKGAKVVQSFIEKSEGDWTLYSTGQHYSSWEVSQAEFPQQERNRLLDGRPGHGAFSYKLIQGLRGEADRARSGNADGLVTFNELSQYVIQEVPQLVSVTKQQIQTPFKAGENSGDVGLATTGTAVVADVIATGNVLNIKTIPAGAEVYLNGNRLGTAPQTREGLSARQYRLEARLTGYQAAQENVQLNNSERRVVTLVLEPLAEEKARLTVERSPQDARVRILNIIPPYTDGMELDPGRYHLEVSLEGYETQKRWVILGNSEQNEIFNLSKITRKVTEQFSPAMPETSNEKLFTSCKTIIDSEVYSVDITEPGELRLSRVEYTNALIGDGEVSVDLTLQKFDRKDQRPRVYLALRGAEEEGNGVELLVSAKTFTIYKRLQDYVVKKLVSGWQHFDGIKDIGMTNHLKIRKNNNKVSFFINDFNVFTTRYNDELSTVVIGGSQGTEFTANHLQVCE